MNGILAAEAVFFFFFLRGVSLVCVFVGFSKNKHKKEQEEIIYSCVLAFLDRFMKSGFC